MTRTTGTRFGLAGVLAVLATAFTLSDVRSQPGRTTTIWKCDKCGQEVGRGIIKPRLSACPHCGVPFAGAGGFVDRPGPPGVEFPQPGFTPPGSAQPGPRSTPTRETAAGSGSTNSDSSGELSDTGALVLKIILGLFVATELLILVGAVFVFVAANRETTGGSRKSTTTDEVFDLD